MNSPQHVLTVIHIFQLLSIHLHEEQGPFREQAVPANDHGTHLILQKNVSGVKRLRAHEGWYRPPFWFGRTKREARARFLATQTRMHREAVARQETIEGYMAAFLLLTEESDG